jgi:Cu/Ag efflux protein CusF
VSHRAECRPRPTLLILVLLLVGVGPFASCHRSTTATTKRYPFTGRVISVDSHEHTAIINGDAVPGFMAAMAMSYKIKPAADLSQLAPGDSISAEVVVVNSDANDESAADYWLENVKVTAHAPQGPTANSLRLSGDALRHYS